MRIMRRSSVVGDEPVPRSSSLLMRDSILATTPFNWLSSSSTIPIMAVLTRSIGRGWVLLTLTEEEGGGGKLEEEDKEEWKVNGKRCLIENEATGLHRQGVEMLVRWRRPRLGVWELAGWGDVIG